MATKMSAQTQVVIVGGGQGAGWAAHTLRSTGFDGRIVLVGDELQLPYERPPLSKGMLTGRTAVTDTYIFNPEDWAALEVDCILGQHATKIDREASNLHLDTGDRVPFDRLLIATGSRPAKLSIPGGDLPGVFYLRSIDDSLRLAKQLRSPGRILIVGAGWIGLEVSAVARTIGHEIIVVEANSRICSRMLEPWIANHLASIHRQNGVEFRLGTGVTSLHGPGKVEVAKLGDGTELEVSAVVVGIGALPNVELAVEAGLAVDNGILVDEFGRTSDHRIYATGDVANYPHPLFNTRVRLESWENAQNHGIHTARSMLTNSPRSFSEVPWFWSDQYHLNIQLIGLPSDYDCTVVRGTPDSDTFCVYYLKDNCLKGATGFNRPRDVRASRRLISRNVPIDPAQLRDESIRVETLGS